MNGWIKLHRKILDWGWYSDIKTRVVFIHLLLIANFEERHYLGKLIKRGDCVICINALAKQTNLTPMQVRTALNHLKSTNDITIKTTNKYSIVTICKFDSYQVFENKDNTPDNKQDNNQVTIKQQTNNTPDNNTIRINNSTNKELENKEDSIAEKSATKKTIKEREIEFYNELVPYIEIYGKDMIRAFYNYWSQKNKDGKKMLWEKQRAFEISKRLVTWSHNEQKQQQQTNKGGDKFGKEWEAEMIEKMRLQDERKKQQTI